MSHDCEGERGKRGKRGHRGHDGNPGPPGGGGGLLKFSGQALTAPGGLTAISYLSDNGFSIVPGPVVVAPNYPVARTLNLRNLATNVLIPVIPPTTFVFIIIELLKNGAPVPGFTITYGPGETGVKTVAAGPTPFVAGVDRFDLKISTNSLAELERGVTVSATVGVE